MKIGRLVRDAEGMGTVILHSESIRMEHCISVIDKGCTHALIIYTNCIVPTIGDATSATTADYRLEQLIMFRRLIKY